MGFHARLGLDLPFVSEHDEAATYWAGRSLGAFSHQREWSIRLIENVAALHPATVFEFGCNVGRHLRGLAARLPGVNLAGMDINLLAVHAARAAGLQVLLGDEYSLAYVPEVDVALTVSVLDHLDSKGLAVALPELDRIGRTLVLIEPRLGREGRIERLPDGSRANPFLYSWDYEAHLPRRSWVTEAFPIAPAAAGPYYRVHIGTR